MRYQGGKFRIARSIAKCIRERFPHAETIHDPFVGGAASALAFLRAGFKVAASDHHEDLVLLLSAVLEMDDPSVVIGTVTAEEYEQLRSGQPSARRGFAGYGASFGGMWFRGFALNEASGTRGYLNRRTTAIQPSDESRRSLLRLREAGKGRMTVSLADYRETPSGALAYCDKPYGDTTDYRGERFDHDAFWRWAERRRGPTFVSEIGSGDAPRHGALEVVWRKNLSVTRRVTGPARREERLYYMPPINERD